DNVLARNDSLEPLAQVIGMEQLAHADAGGAVDLVLVARSNAAAGRADRLAGALLAQALFLDVVRKDQMGVVADEKIVADGDAGSAERLHFLDEANRVDYNAVADHRAKIGAEYARGQQGKLVGLAVPDDRVARIGATVIANDEIMVAGQEIDDLAL